MYLSHNVLHLAVDNSHSHPQKTTFLQKICIGLKVVAANTQFPLMVQPDISEYK